MWHSITIVYYQVFYKPLYNALLVLTGILPGHDLGLAVIILTLGIRILLFPLTHKMVKTQRAMKLIEPEVKRIQREKKNKEDQGRALMELYRAHGIKPLSGFFSLFLQIPLLLALFQVFQRGIPFQPNDAYFFVSLPRTVQTTFLGILPLTTPSSVMAFLAALSQFMQARLAQPPRKEDKQTSSGASDVGTIMQKQMTYMLPFIIFVFSYKLPAAVALYWTVMNVFAIMHEAIVRHKAKAAT